MPYHLSCPEDEFTRLREIVRASKRREVIDVRYATEAVANRVAMLSLSEQAWINLKLQRHDREHHPIVFGVYESRLELNAFALESMEPSLGFIAVSYPFLQRLFHYFSLCLCNPAIFPKVGNTAQEVLPKDSQATTPTWVPRNEERRMFAGLLTSMAMRFLTAHEYAHIVHGHLRLQIASGASSGFREWRASTSTSSATTYQTLKMDADCSAILNACTDEFVCSSLPSSTPLWGGSPGDRMVNLNEQALELWIFSVHSLFRLFEDMRSPIPLGQSTHPEPMQRSMFAIGALDSLHRKLSGVDNADRLYQAMLGFATSAEEAFYSVAVRDPQTSMQPFLSATDIYPYYSTLKTEWARLRPKLEPYNLSAGKLAPAT